MQNSKNLGVGFLVSFTGSIPLGYLNIVGFELFQRSGINKTIFYLLGVISIEFLVIYYTLISAKYLMDNKSLIKFIEAFSIVFILVLAGIFHSSANESNSISIFNEKYFDTTPFVLGLFLSCFNFIQIPFWLSWNLYLLNGNYIVITKFRKKFYVFGAVIGTFLGMLAFILSLNYVVNQVDFLLKYLIKTILPVFFIVLATLQIVKFYKKYYQ